MTNSEKLFLYRKHILIFNCPGKENYISPEKSHLSLLIEMLNHKMKARN